MNKCEDCQAHEVVTDPHLDTRWVWIEDPDKIHYRTACLCEGHREIFKGLGFKVQEGGRKS